MGVGLPSATCCKALSTKALFQLSLAFPKINKNTSACERFGFTSNRHMNVFSTWACLLLEVPTFGLVSFWFSLKTTQRTGTLKTDAHEKDPWLQLSLFASRVPCRGALTLCTNGALQTWASNVKGTGTLPELGSLVIDCCEG